MCTVLVLWIHITGPLWTSNPYRPFSSVGTLCSDLDIYRDLIGTLWGVMYMGLVHGEISSPQQVTRWVMGLFHERRVSE